MVSIQQSDQKSLDPQNVELCSACMMPSVGIYCAGKKEDSTDATIVGLHVTNHFLFMCRKDALLKPRSPMIPKNSLNIPLKDIRSAISGYMSSKK